jgi:HEPN domain-containing protein/predicted nucleotidyltransferase
VPPVSVASEVESAPLRRIVRRIVAAVDPERILLFGSRAKGTASGESDLDLCVIAEMEGDRRERRNRLHTLLRDATNETLRPDRKGGSTLGVDVLTFTPAEFAREKHLLNSVTYFIEKHGRTLYRRSDLPPRDMAEPSESEHDDWVRSWFEKADRDLETMRRTLADDPLPDVTCYHAQQAAEKCLKGFLTARGEEVEKTHVLEKLLDRCIPLDESFEELRDNCERLKGYAVEIRYPNDPGEPDVEEARAARKSAERICAFVRKRVELDV